MLRLKSLAMTDGLGFGFESCRGELGRFACENKFKRQNLAKSKRGFSFEG
ncbi:TPA: hypothetical protein R1X36_000672 [Campylobacter upsaliensis]|nr:hypothetical protein [Campylobacter upsaliensis]